MPSKKIPGLVLITLSFTAEGCNGDPEADAIVGNWVEQDPELKEQIHLEVFPNTAGELQFYSYAYEVEVDTERAPTYSIEVQDGGPTVLECQLTEGVLKCPKPYSMALVKK